MFKRSYVAALFETERNMRIVLDKRKPRKAVHDLATLGLIESRIFFKDSWHTGYGLTKKGREFVKLLHLLDVAH